METFIEFTDRINSFEKKEMSLGDKHFDVSPSVAIKVEKNNKFKNFYGDTVVFALDNTAKVRIAAICDELYRVAPDCFCERLIAQTFHVTLHDLSNGAVLRDIGEELFNNELKVLEKAKDVLKYKSVKIKLKSNNIFNMVSTSLVMGLRPVEESDYRNIMGLYSIFDDVKKLNYHFTPHITLAYYNINGFDLREAKNLEKAVNKLNCSSFEFELDINKLFYQKFRSMNDYIDIINLGQA